MKTLKKTLALVLALVMALGVFGAIPAGAFTDNDKITYKDAVDLLSAIGVLEGFEDGSFKPEEQLTRAQGAKIVACLFLTPAVANALPETNTKFSDVPSYHWASKFVAWAVENGIIDGYGDGTFGPEDPLTGLQFAKMLLAAFGYGAKSEFLGDRWATNAALLSQQLGLMKQVTDAMNNTSSLKRQQASQIASNSITEGVKFVRFVEFLQEYVTGDVLGTGSGESSLNDSKHYDIQLVDGTIGFNTADNTFTFNHAATAATTTAAATIALNISIDNAKPADYGRNVKLLIVNASTAKTAKAIGAITYTDAVIFESGKAVNFQNSTTSSHASFKASAAANVQVIRNGVSSTMTPVTLGTIATSELATTAAGTLTLLINTEGNAKGTIDQIIIVTQSFGILTADARTATSGNTTNVTLPGVSVLSTATNVNRVSGYDGLKKDDAVLVTTMTFNSTSYYYIDKAGTITGLLNGYTGTTADTATAVKIDSTNYTMSGIAPTTGSYAIIGSGGFLDNGGYYGKSFIVYVDAYNNAIAMKTSATASDPDYYVLLDATLGSGFDYTTVYARLMGMDGKIVDIKTDAGSVATLTAWQNEFVTYTESATSGVYKITNVATNAVPAGAASGYNQGKAAIVQSGSTPIVGNSATKFIFYNTTTGRVSIYDGIANTPSGGTLDKVSAVNSSSGIAKYVFISYTGTLVAAGTSETLVYVLDKTNTVFVDSSGSTTVQYYEVKVIDTKGAERSIKVKTSGAGYDLINNASNGEYLFTATTDSAGYTALSVPTRTIGAGYTVPAGGTMRIGGSAFTYDNDTVFIVTTRNAVTGIATVSTGVGSVADDEGTSDRVLYGLKTSTDLLTYVVIEVLA